MEAQNRQFVSTEWTLHSSRKRLCVARADVFQFSAMPFGETIVAPATPVGESALALVRASGPLAPALAAAVLGREAGGAPPPRHATFGEYHACGGEFVDQVVLTHFAAPHSATGEDVLEISCHGNPFIVRKILDDLCARGCRPAAPGEFTRTAFANGKLDLTQAEAVAELIRARSEGALRAARRHLDGEMGRRVADFSARLLQIQAAVEARIDFPEEDLPPEQPGGEQSVIAALARDMAGLLATARYGTLLREGASVVLAGPPNAGKSSLLNVLLGRPRAIVSPEPGTTRDFLEEPLTLGAYEVRLTDTAGLRTGEVGLIEREGIARTLARMEAADVVLIIIDSTIAPPEIAIEVQNAIGGRPLIVVENKTDLSDSSNRPGFLENSPHVRISAKTGQGVDDLKFAIVKLLESSCALPGEELVLTSARQVEALSRTHQALLAADAKMTSASPAELLASDLRQAAEALGEILGLAPAGPDGPARVDNDAMLDHLFAQFCIGK